MQNTRSWRKHAGVLLFASMLTTGGGAATASDTGSFEVGVCTHVGLGWTDPAEFFPWRERSRVSSLRDDILWSDVERQRGVYHLQGRALAAAQAFQQAKSSGMRPMVVLAYGNPLYDNGSQPATTEARQAYAAYAAWMADTLRNDVVHFEIWNEWNLGAGTRPKLSCGSPESYTALYKEARAAIKAVNPSAKVIAGAMAGDADGWPWLRSAIAAGMLDQADGISVHLYNHAGPRAGGGVAEFVRRLQSLRALLAETGKSHVPIYITETGWPNHTGTGHIDVRDAAQRALRMVLETKFMPDVLGVWLYEFSDSGTDIANPEHNFGIMTHAYEEKPIACRLRNTVGPLRRSTGFQAFRQQGVRVHHMTAYPSGRLLAVWLDGDSAVESRAITLRGTGLRARPTGEACGENWNSAIEISQPNQLRVRISGAPMLFWLEDNASISSLELQ